MKRNTLIICALIPALFACDGGRSNDEPIPPTTASASCVADAMTMKQLENLLRDAFARVDWSGVEALKGKGFVEGGYNIYPLSLLLTNFDVPADDIAEAASVLWLSEHEETLELCWWKTDNSLSRLMILTFVLGSRHGEALHTTACPEFPVDRFNDENRKARRREIDWVMEHHDEIHDLLTELTAGK